MESSKETGCQVPEGPILCINNCGFFGSATTMNMCSKCHKDTVLNQQAKLAASSIEDIVNSSSSTNKNEPFLAEAANVESEFKVVSPQPMELDAFRRLFPLRFREHLLFESIRSDGRPLERARDTTVVLGAAASADGSAMAKIGCTTMLAAIKLEVMTPGMDSPDEGCIVIDYHMPPICSPLVRPGRPAELAPVLSKQLSDNILSSGMIDLKELCLVKGKAAWMAYLVMYFNTAHSVTHKWEVSFSFHCKLSLISPYRECLLQDVYCLDADGALFDAALLSALAALSHLQIPAVALNDNGRIVVVSEENTGSRREKEPINKEKRKLHLSTSIFSLTCIIHKNYILADPTSEEESVMETYLTVALDSSFQLVSLNKPGGPGLANESAIQDCISLTRQRVNELQKILNEAVSDMEVD